VGIPQDKVFLMELPNQSHTKKSGFKTLEDLIELGRTVPDLEPLRWIKGQGARQVAYLCYSSGTSGLPVSSLSGLTCKVVELLLTKSARKPL